MCASSLMNNFAEISSSTAFSEVYASIIQSLGSASLLNQIGITRGYNFQKKVTFSFNKDVLHTTTCVLPHLGDDSV